MGCTAQKTVIIIENILHLTAIANLASDVGVVHPTNAYSSARLRARPRGNTLW